MKQMMKKYLYMAAVAVVGTGFNVYLGAGNCLRRWKLQQIEYGNSDRLWLSGQRGASLYE